MPQSALKPSAVQRSSAIHRRVTGPNATILGVVGADTVIAAIVPLTAQPPVMPRIAPPPAAKTARVELPANVPSRAANTAARLTVSAYRLLGFSILTLIVVVLIGYITQTAFFFLSHTWAMPIQVSASDDKVVAMQTALTAQRNARDKLQADLAQADLAVAAEQRFQLDFVKAVKTDLAARTAELQRVSSLASTTHSAGGAIAATSQTYAAATRRKMQAEFNAGLIDRNAMLAGNFQDATIASSTLGLAEREAQLDQRAAELAIETASLDAILGDKASEASLSYEVLKIKRDYDTSKLALSNATAQRDTVKAAIARQDDIIKGIASTAQLRALADKATVAFVPYGNLDGAKEGTRLYRCALGMVMCHRVGVVLAVLPGEVQAKHPHRDKMMRGQMVELRLDAGEEAAVEDDTLFIGSKPIGF